MAKEIVSVTNNDEPCYAESCAEAVYFDDGKNLKNVLGRDKLPSSLGDNFGGAIDKINSDLSKLTESEFITVTCHSSIRNYLACHKAGNMAHIYGLIAVDAVIPINTDFLYTRTAKFNSSFALVNIVGGANNMASIIGNHATNNQAPIAIGTYQIDTWYEI